MATLKLNREPAAWRPTAHDVTGMYYSSARAWRGDRARNGIRRGRDSTFAGNVHGVNGWVAVYRLR